MTQKPRDYDEPTTMLPIIVLKKEKQIDEQNHKRRIGTLNIEQVAKRRRKGKGAGRKGKVGGSKGSGKQGGKENKTTDTGKGKGAGAIGSSQLGGAKGEGKGGPRIPGDDMP